MFKPFDVVVPPEYTYPIKETLPPVVTEGTSPVTSDPVIMEAVKDPTGLILLLVATLLVAVCVVSVVVIKKRKGMKEA